MPVLLSTIEDMPRLRMTHPEGTVGALVNEHGPVLGLYHGPREPTGDSSAQRA